MCLLLINSAKFILKLIIRVLIIITIISLIVSVLFPLSYTDYIYKYSLESDVDPFLVAAIISVESKYQKDAVSKKNARGLMQISAQTGEWGAEVLDISEYNSNMLFDPETNIRIGTWYLRQLKNQFNNDIDLVLAAYNAGSGNVAKWLKDERYSKDEANLNRIPFKETDEYLDKVKFNHTIYKTIYKGYMEKLETVHSLYFDAIMNIRAFLKDLIRPE